MTDLTGVPIENPWGALRRLTAARIALGRTGVSLPTDAHLAFQLAHAQARDAVHLALDVPRVQQDLAPVAAAFGTTPIVVDSAAPDRLTYLQRPDLGRRLDSSARAVLATQRCGEGAQFDLALVVADGLSALAIHRQAGPFLAALVPRIKAERWRVAPLVVVRQARVAIGDEIGQLLGAKMVVILIGERPGLSSPDSMGLYLTWAPAPGLTDAARNCISNVRPAGLAPAAAAAKLHYLLAQAYRRQLTGVALKDDLPDSQPVRGPQKNFLLAEVGIGPP